MKSIQFLRAKIHALSMQETLEYIEFCVQKRHPCQQVVVNVAKIVQMQNNEELAKAVNSSDLINVDGMPIVWASRLLGTPLPERVAGIDLFEKCIQMCSEKGYKPYFFGAKEEVLVKLMDGFLKKYPNLKIAGYRNGYFKKEFETEKKIANDIKESKADMLFIAFGTPDKELFMEKWKSTIDTPFIMGVGGSFDVVAGFTKRAPKWMQNFGLEWFYRILQEPQRMWKRYAKTNPVFIYLVLKEWLKIKFKGSK